MMNRSYRDLDSATLRTKFFGGRSADDIAREMPILPVDAPGIPPPGLSLALFARSLGDVPEEEVVLPKKGKAKAKKPKVRRPGGPHLTALVRSMLYQSGTEIPLEHGGKTVPTEMLPGSLFADGLVRDGPGPCRLMVIGKCLGRAEVANKRPFCGAGSEDLWRAWKEAGIPQVGATLPTYMTNLLRFEPPPAAVARPPADWVEDGVHLLYQELALCRPEYVLILGADALKALFGYKAKISHFKGMVTDLTVNCQPNPDTPEDKFTTRVVVADHPAAVYRDPDLYPTLLASMRFLARQMGYSATAEVLATDYQTILTADELRVAVAETEKASAGGGYVSFDCEWEGRHPKEPGAYLYTVQWSHAPGHARVAYLKRCGGADNPSLTKEAAAPLFRRLLANAPARGARLVAHFGKADLPWLEDYGVDLYPHYVGPRDDPNADGSAGALWAWQKCYFEGAFDTAVAVHAVDESNPLGLDVLTSTILGLDRYDLPVEEWKTAYCAEQKIKKSELRGYGNCPENIMTPYAYRDVDDPGRLYLMYNGDPKAGTQGRLDADRFGFSCRQIFSTRMRAWAAVAEIERVGMEADRTEHKRLRDILAAKRESLVAEFRAAADWPDFAPTRRVHRVEFLFGENFLAAKDPRRPAGALSLYLEPYKATKSTGNEKLWAEAEARWKRGLTGKPLPATDQETMIALGRQHELARMLLNIDFLTTAMKIWFRLPDEMVVSDEDGLDGEEVHGKGFVACIHHDGRIRTRLGHVETGRYSSSGPNLQNVSDSTDERYDRILQWGEFAPEGSPESEMHFKSRSIFRSRPGWYFVAADLKGAEIASAGWFSGDKTLMAHAHRATLKPDDPDLLDLHADLAANTFGLTGSYKEIKKKYKALRVAAKKTRFSHYYGASADTILRQVSQETQDVTIEQIEKLIEGHDKLYPDLSAFFAACRDQARRKGRLCNGYGGSRRFRKVGDRNLQEAQGREAQNWSCQGLVADNIAYALGNLWYEIRDRKLRSRIVLTVHDSIMCECPRDEVVLFADEDSGLLKKAMSDDNPVVITTLDGVPLARGPYRFGIDISVYRSWGIECGKEEWSNF